MMIIIPTYLLTPKSMLKRFVLDADAVYFSCPIRIDIVRRELGLVFVTDPVRGHSYHVQPHHLVIESALTSKQFALVQVSARLP